MGTPIEECIQIINTFHYQPSLILFKENEVIKQAFLKVDAKVIELKNKSFVYCLDVLFKVFWVFNVQYPTTAINVYHFLELLFEINIVKKNSIFEIFQSIVKKQ